MEVRVLDTGTEGPGSAGGGNLLLGHHHQPAGPLDTAGSRLCLQVTSVKSQVRLALSSLICPQPLPGLADPLLSGPQSQRLQPPGLQPGQAGQPGESGEAAQSVVPHLSPQEAPEGPERSGGREK